MQKFLINEQNKLDVLFDELNHTLTKFNNKEFDTYQSVILLLKNVISVFESLGNKVKQSEIEVLVSEILTAKNGINPIKFEKQTAGRLELLNTIIFKVLQQLQNILSNCYQQNEQKLQQAKELITQIIAASLQSGLIKKDDIKKYTSPGDAEKYCAKITKDNNIALGEKRVLLLVSRYDCLLIFDEMLTSLK